MKFIMTQVMENIMAILIVDKMEEKIINGYIAYPGNFKGFACLNYKNIVEGDILVVKSTTPAQVEAISKAKGILVERVGFVQHATIIAREFKKPIIVGLKNITKKVKTGDYITVINQENKLDAIIKIRENVK